MSAWSLVIVDPSGQHGCSDCIKQDVCLSKQDMEIMRERWLEESLTDAHPDKMGWGTLKATCHGYTPI